MQTLFKYEGKTNSKYNYGDIYGIYQNKWQKIHSLDEWQMLSPINKENIFKNCSSSLPDETILNEFIPFSIITYANDDKQRKLNISFIPKDQLLIMKDLISLDQINRILSINIHTVESNGYIYILITNGIQDEDNNLIYYTYDFVNDNGVLTNSWRPILQVTEDGQYSFIINNIAYNLTTDSSTDSVFIIDNEYHNLLVNTENLGKLIARDLITISPEYLDQLFYNMNESKLGFAFLYVPLGENANANLQVCDIDMEIEAKGIWESTQLGVDYTYSYPDSTHININIKNKGKYKINYYS